LAGLALAVPSASPAADLLVPANVQASLTVRILEYDRAFKSWAGNGLTIGLLAKKADGAGLPELRQELNGREAQGLPLKTLDHVYKDNDTLKTWIDHNNVRLLYIAADLETETAVLKDVSRKLPTLVPTHGQFDAGATLGLVVKDGRPRILVNLPAAKTAGMDLDSKLLQLSEVVR
jgi:hypothetical protein